MATLITTLGNASNAALAVPAPSAGAALQVPVWIIAAAALLALIVAISAVAMLGRLVARLGALPDRHVSFAETLVAGVQRNSERMEREFAQILRAPPAGPEHAQSYVRNLRRLLRESAAFVRHTRSYPIGEWPSFELASAFNDWAAIVDSTESLLDDMFRELLDSPGERSRWSELYEQYRREEWYVREDLNRLPDLVKRVETAARPFRKKDGHGHTRHGEPAHAEPHG